jgi:exonuclease 3'-5' domain-containing protein 1
MKSIETGITDTTEQIRDLVDRLIKRHTPPTRKLSPTIYIDLEGVNLCRHGSISILTLLVDTGTPVGHVYLIDVTTPGADAFETVGSKGKSLKDILQDEAITKVFFDVRNDSDALYAHFGVALKGIEDVQLMESAMRKTTASRKYVNGLSKCVQENVPLSASQVVTWKRAKEKGGRLFDPKLGGSHQVFNQRPLSKDIITYCVGDVQHLPALRNGFWQGRTSQWRTLILEESKKRVEASQKPSYQPKSPDKALAPWSKAQHTQLDDWHAPTSYGRRNFRSLEAAYDDLMDDLEDDRDYDWYDDGPTSCRDIISDSDMHLYYSD